MRRREFNLVEFFDLLKDFKDDMKTLISMIVNNKGSLSDLRNDVKRLIAVLDKLTEEENVQTFKRFVGELEKFNKNAEILSRELEDLKKLAEQFSELAEALRR